MVFAYDNTDATYWFLILTPFILGALLVAIRNITRDRD
jgi:hypothetical protein